MRLCSTLNALVFFPYIMKSGVFDYFAGLKVSEWFYLVYLSRPSLFLRKCVENHLTPTTYSTATHRSMTQDNLRHYWVNTYSNLSWNLKKRHSVSGVRIWNSVAGFSGCIPKKNRTLLTEMSRFCHCKQSAWTMKQGRVSELNKVIVCKLSRELFYETEFEIWAGLDRPAGLKLSAILLRGHP